ncbi:type II toxin-antitoxin system HicA family toxin [bacterium]|nr:type II toxin-antitoxin system HicA family toxin [bacterium]
MGRLAGFTYKKVSKKLRNADFIFLRTAKGSHEIWFCEKRNLYTTIPHRNGDIPEGTLRAIIGQAKISIEKFLEL